MSRIRSTGGSTAVALLLGLVAVLSATAQPVSSPPPSSSAPGTGAGTTIQDLLGNGGASGSGGGTCSAPTAGATCGGAGPASQGNTSGVNLGAGNPINLTHGNKFQTEVDLPALPGELGLEIVRHYNSSARHVIGQLGMGWRLSYETDLYDVGATVQILQADGARLMFNIDPARPSLCTGQNPAQGWVEIRPAAAGGSAQDKEYIWHWTHGEEAGRRLSFNAQGKLVQIVSASGAVLSITRGPRGELLQVTDPQGRRLGFQHASTAQRQAATEAQPVFAGIQHIDSPLGRFSYTHGSGQAQVGNLVRVHLPTQVDDTRRAHDRSNRRASTSRISRLYHYEDPRHPQALTGISVLGTGSDGQTLDQRLATYRYDERARAVFSARGAVDKPRGSTPTSDQQSTPATEQVQLQFQQSALPTREGRTLLTNSLGQQTLYTHRIIGGEYRLTEALGAGCAACGPVNMRWRYDEQGRLVEMLRLAPATIIDGALQGAPLPQAAIRHTLDAQGRTVRIEHIAYASGRPQAPELVERHEYTDKRWPDKPTLLARPSVLTGHEHQKALSYNDAGQTVALKESGWAPPDNGNRPAEALQRTTTHTYERINGRSLLTQVDGPLPNGPANSPADSDITTYGWDPRGNFLTTVTLPGGLSNHLSYDAHTGLVSRVVNDAGFATDFKHDARLNLTQFNSQGPGWAQPQVRRFTHDALGRVIETHAGPEGSLGTAESLNAYDGAGRLLWRASAKGELQQWRHDSEGHVLAQGRHSNRMSLEWQPSMFAAAGTQEAPLPPSTAQPAPATKPRQRQWPDDFGRTVRSDSPDGGTTLRRFDEADRLTGMTDANGNFADYRYDVQGRIVSQTITDTTGATNQRSDGGPARTTTEWRYNKRQLLEVIHPTQRERFEYDARGLRSARAVTLVTPGAEHVAFTRYEHDTAGQLTATSLPDGTRLVYARNGQQQVVGVSRQRVRTPWLRWLEAEQDIAHGFARDLVGVQQYTAGNGTEAQWQRSRDGALARMVTRRTSTTGPALLGASTQESIERLLGIRSAHASAPAGVAGAEAPEHSPSPEPGALGVASDPQALIDHRYLWSPQGLLLLDRQRAGQPADHTQTHHAYNQQGQLIASVASRPAAGQWQEDAVWRYAYDAHQRRILSQQNAGSQADTRSQTQTTRFLATSNRLAEGAQYDAAGRPERLGEREYVWDALGRLTEVRGRSASGTRAPRIANYRYDHRGLRNTKTVGGTTTHYLHDESRQPLAELDAQGRIQRQYVYLADLPIAVIDTPAHLVADDEGMASVLDDLAIAFGSWVNNKTQDITWLHTNHLGAPEAASNAQGDLVWRARYAPFGAARIEPVRPEPVEGRSNPALPSPAFSLNLRLPGQVYDAETGLHYNRQRYYDPALGQYLTPDPLGNPDGLNPYAYVAFNPLGFVDPDGLVLFAFDGTGNDRNSRTSVLLFAESYASFDVFDQEMRYQGDSFYVQGVGTSGGLFDNNMTGGGLAVQLGQRVNQQLSRLDRYVEQRYAYYDAGPGRREISPSNPLVFDIDIVGFSRGAAAARDFANQINTRSGEGYYRGLVDGGCVRINLRFMGLFDTVLSTSMSSINLGIPASVEHVAHAVAANEHRRAFPLESIEADSADPGWSSNRIERGFIGAHSDIGGGYNCQQRGCDGGDLSDVALAWMVQQAQQAGVQMLELPEDLRTVSNPIVHDERRQASWVALGSGPDFDREVRYADGHVVPEIEAPLSGLNHRDTQRFLVDRDPNLSNVQAARVNMQDYALWLNRNYGIDARY